MWASLDAAVDRSGWDHWWAQDLDESDEAVRSGLLRTTSCPDAINKRTGDAKPSTMGVADGRTQEEAGALWGR